MESRHELIFLPCGDDLAVNGSQYLRVARHLGYIRRAYKGHGDLSDAAEFRFGVKAAKLSAVGVAHSTDIHCGKMQPLVVFDFFGKQQKSRTGAEYGQSRFNSFPQRLEQPQLAHQLALHGAFTAGDDKSVEGCLKVLFLPDLKGGNAQPGKHLLMLDERSLQSQYGDVHSLFSSFRHQKLDLLLVDTDHCLAKVFGKLGYHLCVGKVGDRLDDGSRALCGIAGFEDA